MDPLADVSIAGGGLAIGFGTAMVGESVRGLAASVMNIALVRSLTNSTALLHRMVLTILID